VDGACVLTPGDVHLSTTGAEVGGWVVLGGAAVALGVVLLLLALLLRRRRGSRRGAQVAVIAALVLALFGGGQIAPAPVSAATGGCDLLGWSMLSNFPTETDLTETPTLIVAFRLKNVSNVPIAVNMRTDTKSDADGLAPFVQVDGNCAQCSPNVVYDATVGAVEPGPDFSLAPGASADIEFLVSLLPGVVDNNQEKSTTFGIIALARQI
jgi:uncharacterized protein (TIGR03382 family)